MKGYRDPSHWDNQTLSVKCLRWWRYMPAAYVAAWVAVVAWWLSGSPQPYSVPIGWRNVVRAWLARAEFRMGMGVPLEEVIERLREEA